MTDPYPGRRMKRFRRWGVAIAIVLLPAWYVAAWILASVAYSAGYLPGPWSEHGTTLFKPLMDYSDSDHLGAHTLQRLFCWARWDDVLSVHRDVVQTSSDPDAVSIRFGPFSPKITGKFVRELVRDQKH